MSMTERPASASARLRLVIVSIVMLALTQAVSYAAPIEGFDQGDLRIGSRSHFVGFDSPYWLQDLAPDGNRAAFLYYIESSGRWRLGELDLRNDSLRFVATVPHTDIVLYSPDDRRVVIKQGSRLKLVELDSGDLSDVGHVHRNSQVRWLDDGRLAYLTRDRRLVFTSPEGEVTDTGFSAPDPAGRDSLVRFVSVSSDGGRVVFAEDCRSWLHDLSSGERTKVRGRSTAPPNRSWAPDGRHFVLQKTTWERGCTRQFNNPVFDILFSSEGGRIGHVLGDRASLSHGHELTWSSDGDRLLITNQVTGTGVTGLKQLFAVEVDGRRVTRVLKARTIAAFVDANERVVFARYASAEGPAHGRLHGAVYTGRLRTR